MVCKWHKRSYSAVVVLGVLLCVCSALGGFTVVEGQAPVWSDNFDDGTFAPEWTAIEGTFTVIQNRLWSYIGAYCWISHASAVAEGEWRFDLMVSTGDIRVSFIALDTDMFGIDHSRPNNGYCIQFSAGVAGSGSDGSVLLYRFSDGNATLMDWYSDTNLQNQEQQVIVTRDSAGVFNVFVNGAHKFQVQATQHSTSLYFLVLLNYGYIDNIEVYDQILTQPPDGGNGNDNGTTPPPPIPGFPAVAIAVGTISALTIGVLYRRRQSPAQPK